MPAIFIASGVVYFIKGYLGKGGSSSTILTNGVALVTKAMMPKLLLPNDWSFVDSKIQMQLRLIEIEAMENHDGIYDVILKGIAHSNGDSPIKLHLKVSAIIGTGSYYVSDLTSIYAVDNHTIVSTFEAWKRNYLLHLQNSNRYCRIRCPYLCRNYFY